MNKAMAIAILLTLSGTWALPGEGGLCPEHYNELRAASADMNASRDALGAERHDTEIQDRQKRILDRLDRLIARMQDPPPPPSPPEPPPPGEPPHGPCFPGDPTPDNPVAPVGNRPTSPAQKESSTGGTTDHGRKAALSAVGAKWGELPPKVRAAIQACESTRLPEKYRKMVEIYLISVSEERDR